MKNRDHGVKSRLADTIIPIIESVPHETYAEVFMGMDGAFYRRTRMPKCEIINDISRDVDPAGLTDIRRAARFLYLQKLAYGSKVTDRQFGVTPKPSGFDLSKLVPMLDDIHGRLTRVTIENLPFGELIH